MARPKMRVLTEMNPQELVEALKDHLHLAKGEALSVLIMTAIGGLRELEDLRRVVVKLKRYAQHTDECTSTLETRTAEMVIHKAKRCNCGLSGLMREVSRY